MLIFLKLGGSLITEKNNPHTVRIAQIESAAKEIKSALHTDPDLKLIIGHGSGSYGHVPAKKYGTRNGVYSKTDWIGFTEVHSEASELNAIVMNTFRKEGLPCINFSPLSYFLSNKHILLPCNLSGIISSLNNGIIPVVFGDTVFDLSLGGTIFSTEEIFIFLAQSLHISSKILLSGIEKGIWKNFPSRDELYSDINLNNQNNEWDQSAISSIYTDVTGGMKEKVRLMKNAVQFGLIQEAIIFSGEIKGNILNALSNQNPGTRIYLK